MSRGPASITFAMLDESGHLNPTFKLARALAARGHRVGYLVGAEAQPTVEAQGFSSEALLPELYERGLPARERGFSTFARRRAITRRFGRALERLEREPDRLLSARPELLLIDVTLPHVALWAKRTGQRFAYVNTSLPQTHDLGVPPLRSGRMMRPGVASAFGAELDWVRFLAKRRVSAALADLVGMCPPYELARRAAGRFGVAAAELDTRTAYMPQLRGVPELVLCPEAFDFPRPPVPHRLSVASVDLSRREAAVDLGVLPANKPLVYCALGGQRYRAAETPGFFRRLLRAFESQPGWHLLLAVGKHAAPASLGPFPANVTVLESAPQLAVLRRARAMITHAGLGSVKECVMLGVPMVAVPLDVDQPANAARIAYHGLGAQVDVAEVTPAALVAALAPLVGDGPERARVLAMRERFLEVEDAERGADRVRALLDGAPAHPLGP
jgi:UDP:flavonoid glycosyltransferase YjiC (YdhE family)